MPISNEQWLEFPPAAASFLGNKFNAAYVSTAGRVMQGKSGKPTFGAGDVGARLQYGNTLTYRVNQLGYQPTGRFAELEVDHINGDFEDNRLCNRQFLLKAVHAKKTTAERQQ